jgi:hypothetical protein
LLAAEHVHRMQAAAQQAGRDDAHAAKLDHVRAQLVARDAALRIARRDRDALLATARRPSPAPAARDCTSPASSYDAQKRHSELQTSRHQRQGAPSSWLRQESACTGPATQTKGSCGRTVPGPAASRAACKAAATAYGPCSALRAASMPRSQTCVHQACSSPSDATSDDDVSISSQRPSGRPRRSFAQSTCEGSESDADTDSSELLQRAAEDAGIPAGAVRPGSACTAGPKEPHSVNGAVLPRGRFVEYKVKAPAWHVRAWRSRQCSTGSGDTSDQEQDAGGHSAFAHVPCTMLEGHGVESARPHRECDWPDPVMHLGLLQQESHDLHAAFSPLHPPSWSDLRSATCGRCHTPIVRQMASDSSLAAASSAAGRHSKQAPRSAAPEGVQASAPGTPWPAHATAFAAAHTQLSSLGSAAPSLALQSSELLRSLRVSINNWQGLGVRRAAQQRDDLDHDHSAPRKGSLQRSGCVHLSTFPHSNGESVPGLPAARPPALAGLHALGSSMRCSRESPLDQACGSADSSGPPSAGGQSEGSSQCLACGGEVHWPEGGGACAPHTAADTLGEALDVVLAQLRASAERATSGGPLPPVQTACAQPEQASEHAQLRAPAEHSMAPLPTLDAAGAGEQRLWERSQLVIRSPCESSHKSGGALSPVKCPAEIAQAGDMLGHAVSELGETSAANSALVYSRSSPRTPEVDGQHAACSSNDGLATAFEPRADTQTLRGLADVVSTVVDSPAGALGAAAPLACAASCTGAADAVKSCCPPAQHWSPAAQHGSDCSSVAAAVPASDAANRTQGSSATSSPAMGSGDGAAALLEGPASALLAPQHAEVPETTSLCHAAVHQPKSHAAAPVQDALLRTSVIDSHGAGMLGRAVSSADERADTNQSQDSAASDLVRRAGSGEQAGKARGEAHDALLSPAAVSNGANEPAESELQPHAEFSDLWQFAQVKGSQDNLHPHSTMRRSSSQPAYSAHRAKIDEHCDRLADAWPASPGASVYEALLPQAVAGVAAYSSVTSSCLHVACSHPPLYTFVCANTQPPWCRN